MSKTLHLIVVGKLKSKELTEIENDYLKRIKNPDLAIHEVKAFAEKKELEGAEVIKKIQDIAKDSSPVIIALAEQGKEFNSVDFSDWINSLIENNQKIIFVIAGAEGHAPEVLSLAHQKLSLSRLTFPHKIARILFVEQIYRAQTIKTKHPYHN